MDEAAVASVPWTELSPSDYVFLTGISELWPPYEKRQAYAMAPAVLAAVLALADTRVAHLAIGEKRHVFGLFVGRSAWVSKGESQGSWPVGSIESSLEMRLTETPVKMRDLVAGWIGSKWPDPWQEMLYRIFGRMIWKGIVKRHQENHSFLFFSWQETSYRPAERMEEVLANYANAAGDTGLGLPLLDSSSLRLAQRDVFSGEIDRGFTDRTESSGDPLH